MNIPDTWQRAHCVQCFQCPDECEVCGCHIEPEAVATQANPRQMWDNGGTTKAAPDECANTAEGLTSRTNEES